MMDNTQLFINSKTKNAVVAKFPAFLRFFNSNLFLPVFCLLYISSVASQEIDPDDLDLLPDMDITFPLSVSETPASKSLGFSTESTSLTTSSDTSTPGFELPFKTIDPELIDRYKSLYKNRATGAEYDPATGTVTFAVTDVSIPGNSSLPVELRRWVPADDLKAGGFGNIGWHWDIPMIKANYMAKNPHVFNGEIINVKEDGWRVGKNCSNAHSTRLLVSNRHLSYEIDAVDYWSGKQLHIPGKTTEKFLEESLTDGSIKQITKSNFYVDACTTLASGQEGFIVKGPDGSKYTFDHIQAYYTGDLTYNNSSPATTATKLLLVSKIEDKFGNTVEYKYNAQGNLEQIVGSDGRLITISYTSYTYKGVTYYIADKVTANNKVWTYKYSEYGPDNLSAETRKMLTQVVLPDETKWQYDLKIGKVGVNVRNSHRRTNYIGVTKYSGINPALCEAIKSTNLNNVSFPFSTNVTTPDGLKTVYSFAVKYHGRAKVNPQTVWEPHPPPSGVGPGYISYNARNLNCSANFSLVNKIVTGQNLTPQTWTYQYSENVGTYLAGNDQFGYDYNGFLSGPFAITTPNGKPSTVSDTENFRTTTVTGPDSKVVYYIDRLFQSPTEGSVVAEDYLNLTDDSLLKRMEYSFAQDVYVGEFWFVQSTEFDAPTRLSLNGNQIQHRINKIKERTQIYNTGGIDEYTVEYNDYDDLGFYGKTIESNDISDSTLTAKRYTKQNYLHDEANWLLGLPTKTFRSSSDSFAATPDVEIIYHDNTTNLAYTDWQLPYQYKSFGTWIRQYPEYYTTGTAKGRLKKIKYNQHLSNSAGVESTTKYRYQLLANYHRGRAQTITIAGRYGDLDTDKMSFSRVTNDDGWVTSITDLNQNTVAYAYDSVGRLSSVDMQSADWLDTYIQWEQVPGNAIKRIASRCDLNAGKLGCLAGTVKTTDTSSFDALYRILNSHQSAGALNKYQTFTFDSLHNPTFSSFVAGEEGETRGTNNEYDDIGRIISSATSNGGTIKTAYLKGNKVEVTDAEKNVTTTTYLAYGSPSYEQALSIESPENVTTTQAFNIFGDITSITQSGPGKNGVGEVSQTEHRAYDANHHLCKITRKDVGTTVFNNNVLGEVQWQAQGVSGGAVTNCTSNATTSTHADAAKKVNMAYDNLGDLWKADYVNGTTPDVTYTRDKNGNVLTLAAGNVTTTYTYNSLNVPETESLAVDGKTFNLDYHYANSEALSGITYPDGDRVNFAPDGFGQAKEAKRQAKTGRAAQTYASSAQYYPSGSIDTFNYGNGLVHKTILNTRNIPQSIKDSKTGLTALSYNYTYDDNLNIKSIIDNNNNGAYSLTNLTYDGLDRLLTTTGGSAIGNSTMNYDGLGNITKYNNSKGQNLNYNYNTTTNLLTSVSGMSGKYGSFGYDDRGNIYNNGSGRTFEYNRANQLTTSGSNSYVYDGHNRRVKQTDSKGSSYSVYGYDGTLLHRETPTGALTIFIWVKS